MNDGCLIAMRPKDVKDAPAGVHSARALCDVEQPHHSSRDLQNMRAHMCQPDSLFPPRRGGDSFSMQQIGAGYQYQDQAPRRMLLPGRHFLLTG